MSKPSISEIIECLKEATKSISLTDQELACKIDKAILDLQEVDKPSKIDKIIDRSKKISEILNPFLKIMIDFFIDS